MPTARGPGSYDMAGLRRLRGWPPTPAAASIADVIAIVNTVVSLRAPAPNAGTRPAKAMVST
jgi:hypothetical protein